MGAQGPVFRAQDTVAGQIVAIKAFKLDVSPELAPSIADALRALVGQAPSVEGLVPLIDAGLEGDTPWLAMEHLSCPTLDTRLRDGGLLPLDEATALVRALADAVDTAHAHGLDHGSLHPRDVFLPEGGGVVVSGFGVAAAVGVAGLRPPRRRPFTAPETLAQKPLDAPADRYALGVMAYEIVSGRRLLGAGDDLAAGLAARAETSDVPRAATALAAMLAERPEHRPSTATAFAQALCAALESPPPPAAPLAAVIPPPSRPARPAGEPPTSEALAEFARQGTFWEPPRRGVDDPDAATVVAGPPPSRTVDDPPTGAGRAASGLPRTADRGRARAGRSEPAAGAGADADRARPSGSIRRCASSRLAAKPANRCCSGRSATPRNGRPRRSPVQEQAAHTPPLVVLALTLGLGLAVGAAGGYLVGHRSGERAAQRALGGETGTTSATYGDTAPSTPSGARCGRAGDGREWRIAPAGARGSVAVGAAASAPAATGQTPPAASAAPATPRGRPAPAVGDRPARHPIDADARRRHRRRRVARPHADHRARAERRHALRPRRRGRLRVRDAARRRRRALGRHHGVVPAGARARARASGAGRVQAGREDRRAARRVAPVRRRRPHRRPRRGDDAAADLRSRAGRAPGAARAAGPPPVGDDRDHRRRAERARRRVARGKH